jgi:hypothetical protein
MDIARITWNPLHLHRRRSEINTTPNYQRLPVWSLDRKQWFIDSIVRKLDIPKLYVRELRRDKFEVIDGQQRIQAIWDFYENIYPLPLDAASVDGYPVANCTFDQLPTKLKEDFDIYELAVVVVRSSDEEEIRDMFVRLQNGVPLKSAEIRHAMTGAFRDLCFELSKHPFFSRCAFENKRYDQLHKWSLSRWQGVRSTSPTSSWLRNTENWHTTISRGEMVRNSRSGFIATSTF